MNQKLYTLSTVFCAEAVNVMANVRRVIAIFFIVFENNWLLIVWSGTIENV